MTTKHSSPAAVRAVHVPAAEAESVAFLGGRIDVRLTGEHTRGWLCIHDSRLPAGTVTPLHVHPHDVESFVVLEGSVEYVVDGVRILAQAGDALHVPRGIPPAFRVAAPAVWRVLGIAAPPGHERFFALAGDPLDAPLPPDMA